MSKSKNKNRVSRENTHIIYSKTSNSTRGVVYSEVIERYTEVKYFVTSDLHIDSVYCDRDYLISDLKDAVSKNAKIVILGDLFDAMQGRFDPRRNMDELRPEYRRSDYYDFVIADVAKILEPFAKNIMLIADGNHELSVLKNAGTSLIDRLIERFSIMGYPIHKGGYGGWIRFMSEVNGVPQGSIKLKYFHGAGGEAPVTRGAIQTNRQAVYLPDAEIVINGHSHNQLYIPIARERLSNKGNLYFDIQHHIRTPGYKQAYADGSTGWEVTRGGVPKPLGGVYITLYNNMIRLEQVTHAPKVVSPVMNIYQGIVFLQE